LVLAEYQVSGNVLTKESIFGEVKRATLDIATKIGLCQTNVGPYPGEGAMYRSGVKTTGAEPYEFDFKSHLRRKMDHLLAERLEREAAAVEAQEIGTALPHKLRMTAGKRRIGTAERIEMPSEYADGTKTPKGLLDRARKQMHLRWNELWQLIEKEWIRQETQRRKDLGLDPAASLGLSLASLYAIRRGHTMEQPRLEAIAAVLSSAKEPIKWESLVWRDQAPIK
jgi:hypothetical protein